MTIVDEDEDNNNFLPTVVYSEVIFPVSSCILRFLFFALTEDFVVVIEWERLLTKSFVFFMQFYSITV